MTTCTASTNTSAIDGNCAYDCVHKYDYDVDDDAVDDENDAEASPENLKGN